MPMSKAVALMRAAEKARAADRRVTEAQRALKKAIKARDRADAQYLALVPTPAEFQQMRAAEAAEEASTGSAS
jgi:hypothetical protein